jgi:glycosyltransferase involved in cell wall biosynthesis
MHIPMPGDHYSPVTGSSVITVIYELTRQHHAAGGDTTVIVGRGTQEGFPPYPVGRVAEVDFGNFPDKPRRILDILAGRMRLGRPFMTAAYRAGLDAIPPDFDGCVFFHNAPAPIPYYRRRLPRARLALYLHNILLNSYTQRELVQIVDSCDAVICVSRFVTEYLARRLGRECPRAHVVLNGVDLSTFNAELPRPVREEPVVLYLGRLSPDKGPEILLQASLELVRRNVLFRLRVVGGFDSGKESSPYARQFRDLADRLEGRLDLRPFQARSEVPGLYQGAHIFCAPSNCDDACPLTLGEAMASGLPCVVARRGGIPEVGRDAVLYFNPPDHVELADRLEEFLRDPAMREEYGRMARSRAEQLTWEHSYQKLREAVGSGVQASD